VVQSVSGNYVTMENAVWVCTSAPSTKRVCHRRTAIERARERKGDSGTSSATGKQRDGAMMHRCVCVYR
jgi:heme A synthase